MPRWTEPMIRAAERQTGAPMDYLRRVADASRGAFAKFGLFLPLASHRKRTPTAVWHLARLAATQAQDCGTCVQIIVNQARQGHVPAATLRAALAGDAAGLTDDERLALAYGRAVANRTDDASRLAEAVRARWGDPVQVELALAVATAQVFPVVKRGLGMATACALVRIDVGGDP